MADVFDALTHRRPYKEPWPIHVAVREILGETGTKFDPRVTEAFERLDHARLVLSARRGRSDRARSRTAQLGRGQGSARRDAVDG